MSPLWLKTQNLRRQNVEPSSCPACSHCFVHFIVEEHLFGRPCARLAEGKERRVTMASGTPLPELMQPGRPVPSLVNSQNQPSQGGLGSTRSKY
eukprot:2049843-Amphidinium_carterae.1